jgi:hypothetical protein
MAVDQIQEVAGAHQLHPAKADQIGRQERRDGSESKRPQNAVPKGFTLLRPGQPEHENGQDHRVVGTEKTFESDEKSDREEVVRREHYSQYDAASGFPPRTNIDTPRIKT